MTNEQLDELLKQNKNGRQLRPEMIQIIKAFVKVVESKDYPIMKRMTIARWFIGIGDKYNIAFIRNYGYRKTLKIIEKVDYLWWETKTLRELLH